jgi:uncharacterized protein YaiE (UPF0345 family)
MGIAAVVSRVAVEGGGVTLGVSSCVGFGGMVGSCVQVGGSVGEGKVTFGAAVGDGRVVCVGGTIRVGSTGPMDWQAVIASKRTMAKAHRIASRHEGAGMGVRAISRLFDFDSHRDGFGTAQAERRHAPLKPAIFQRVDQCDDHTRAACPDRMAQGNRAAVDVQLVYR